MNVKRKGEMDMATTATAVSRALVPVAPSDHVTVEWGNVTPDGDHLPRQTEKDARRTATNRGWPVIRRAITITPWALADD